MDHEPEYYVFDFNEACFVDFIAEIASACDISLLPLDLKP